jgi:hypothetical protein
MENTTKMKISPKLITDFRDVYNNYSFTNFGHSENNRTLLLIISFLYHSEKINRARFLALSKQIKENKMDRRVNTFHCTINDKWYTDERTLNIYLDVFYNPNADTMVSAVKGKILWHDVDFKDILPILMLHTGKNKNFTIDWLFYEFIQPILEKYEQSGHYFSVNEWGIQQSLQMMQTFGIDFTKSNMKPFHQWKDGNVSGYCCEDCDGEYESYASNQYACYVVSNNKKTLREDFSIALNRFKDPSYLKNPALIAKNYIL